MNILPMNAHADKKHWVVRWLRYTGYMEVIAAVVVGLFYSYTMLARLIAFTFGLDITPSTIIALLLGGFVSFVVGLGISLPAWALAMMIDDLHALRLYNSGYVVMDETRKDDYR